MKKLFTFDKDIAAIIKNNSFIINIKKKNFGFKKYLFDETLNLMHFSLVNEIIRNHRF